MSITEVAIATPFVGGGCVSGGTIGYFIAAVGSIKFAVQISTTLSLVTCLAVGEHMELVMITSFVLPIITSAFFGAVNGCASGAWSGFELATTGSTQLYYHSNAISNYPEETNVVVEHGNVSFNHIYY